MKLFINTLLYIFGMGDNPIPKDNSSDLEAISKDWINVGNDIRTAMNKYGQQQPTY